MDEVWKIYWEFSNILHENITILKSLFFALSVASLRYTVINMLLIQDLSSRIYRNFVEVNFRERIRLSLLAIYIEFRKGKIDEQKSKSRQDPVRKNESNFHDEYRGLGERDSSYMYDQNLHAIKSVGWMNVCVIFATMSLIFSIIGAILPLKFVLPMLILIIILYVLYGVKLLMEGVDKLFDGFDAE